MRKLFYLFLLLLSGCNARFTGFYGTSPFPNGAGGESQQFSFVSQASIPSYTCTALTINSVTASGAAFTATATTAVTLSGLGSGSAYSTLANCRAGTSSTTTLFLNAGSSSLTFYYRTSTAESLTIRATTSGGVVGTLNVNTVLFQVLGQPNTTGVIQTEKGQSFPFSPCIAGGKLFIADSSHNRVLVWNTLPTTTAQTPDFVLGQPNLITVAVNYGGRSATSMSGPQGVFSDGTHLFVADTGNSRVLMWSSIPTTNGQAASFVLGQANFGAAVSGAPSDSSLSFPVGVYSNGTRVYVADSGLNRVMVWNAIPTSNGQSASFVLGQSDFISGDPNQGFALTPTDTGLWNPVAVHSDGTRLFVADKDNSRVLVWNAIPNATASPASFALGQADLNSQDPNNPALSKSSLSAPTHVSTDGTRLFITDNGNMRILGWNVMPTTSGQVADFILGQPDEFTTTDNTGGISGATLNQPTGVYSDGTHLVITDKFNNRTLMWNTLPSCFTDAASLVLGQTDFTSRVADTFTPTSTLLYNPQSIHTDGTRLFVVDSTNHRILVWNTLPTSNTQPADFALGQTDLNSKVDNCGGTGTPSGTTLCLPSGVYSDGTHLFVADYGNMRVLIWNTIPTTYGQPANISLGQNDLTQTGQNNGGLSASSLNFPQAVASDGTRVFVADRGNSRVLIWNSIPTSHKQAADVVVGQADFVTTSYLSTAQYLSSPYGVAVAGSKLLVADTGNNRVMIWNTIPTSNFQAANIALGQTNLTNNGQNNGGVSASSMGQPMTLFSDGTRLLVSDNLNHRVMGWNTIPTATNQASDFVIGQPNFTSTTANNGGLTASTLSSPWSACSDGTRVFTSDAGNQRVLVSPIPGI